MVEYLMGALLGGKICKNNLMREKFLRQSLEIQAFSASLCIQSPEKIAAFTYLAEKVWKIRP